MPNSKKVKKFLPLLLILIVFNNLMQQLFVTVSPVIATHFNLLPSHVSIIDTISTIALGVCSVLYGALSDFVPIKKILSFAISLLIIGALIGFFLQSYFAAIVVARALQTMGQAALGSMYLVMVTRYLSKKDKIKYFSFSTACFQLSQALGVLIGGTLTKVIPWTYLILIPLVGALFIPAVLRLAPSDSKNTGKKADILGLSLFTGFIVCTIMALNKSSLIFLIGAILFFIIFIVYININKNAFITLNFFKENPNYVRANSVVWIIYFVQYAFSFIFTFIISHAYELSLGVVSMVMLPSYLAATCVGFLSSKIVSKLGKTNTIRTGITCLFLGLFISGIFISSGPLVLAVCAISFNSGFNLIYSPIYDTVTSSLPANEIGRGIGMNDLTMNITASIGITIAAKIFSIEFPTSFPSITNSPVLIPYQLVLLLFSAIMIIGLIHFERMNKKIILSSQSEIK